MGGAFPHESPVKLTRMLDVYPDAASLYHEAAESFVTIASQAVRERGRCSIALAGGATPSALYALLATKPFRSRVPWHAVHVFWGDERCVPPDDPRSNYRGAYESLLSLVPLPPANTHRMRGEIDPHEAAAEYERLLRAHFATPTGAARFTAGARFDLVLLGVGTDGHTASLFPGGSAVHESVRWVAADYAPSAAMWRVTLTPPLLNAAAHVHFLAAGAEKQEIVSDVLGQTVWWNAARASHDGKADVPVHARFPAAVIMPAEGELRWLVDAAAAPTNERQSGFLP